MISDRLYTIGYSGFQIDEFIETLKGYGISAVIDVRSNPYSGYFRDYDAEQLRIRLRNSGISYRNYAREFGARHTDPAYFSHDGYLDFGVFAASTQFLDGTRKVVQGIEAGFVPVLMCAEKNPAACHRAILVSRWFHENGYEVIHILPDGVTQSQDDVVNQLKSAYFPNRAQLSFDNLNKTEDDYAREAYKIANEKIGYREAAENSPDADPYYDFPDAAAI